MFIDEQISQLNEHINEFQAAEDHDQEKIVDEFVVCFRRAFFEGNDEDGDGHDNGKKREFETSTLYVRAPLAALSQSHIILVCSPVLL